MIIWLPCVRTLWLLLIVFLFDLAVSVRDSGTLSFAIDGAASPTTPARLQSYYHVLQDTFGVGIDGDVSARVVVESFDWEAMDALDLSSIYLMSPPVVSAFEVANSSWLQAAMNNNNISGSSLGITKYAQVMQTVANVTAVFVRLYQSDVWHRMRGADDGATSGGFLTSTVPGNPCGVPFVGGAQVTGSVDDNGKPTGMTASFHMTINATDYFTLVVLQCSNIPMSVTYSFAMVNQGGLELSFSDIPYLGLFSFYSTLYSVLLLFWGWYMLGVVRDHWKAMERARTRREQSLREEGHSHQQDTEPPAVDSLSEPQHMYYCWNRLEILITILLVLKVTENLIDVGKNQALQRSIQLTTTSSEQLRMASTGLLIISSSVLLLSILLVGVGWTTWQHKIPVKQKRIIVLFVVLFFILRAILRDSYGVVEEGSLNKSMYLGSEIVYLLGCLYAVVQLRSCTEALRIDVITSGEVKPMLTLARLNSLRSPHSFNILAVVLGWLLNRFVHTDETSTFLQDAVGEFRVMYWLLVMMIFLRRKIVIF